MEKHGNFYVYFQSSIEGYTNQNKLASNQKYTEILFCWVTVIVNFKKERVYSNSNFNLKDSINQNLTSHQKLLLLKMAVIGFVTSEIAQIRIERCYRTVFHGLFGSSKPPT